MLGYIIAGIYFPEKVYPPDYKEDDLNEGAIPFDLHWVNESSEVEGYDATLDGKYRSKWHQCFLDARDFMDHGGWVWYDSSNARLYMDIHIDEVVGQFYEIATAVVQEANKRFTEQVKADLAAQQVRTEAIEAYRAKVVEVDRELRGGESPTEAEREGVPVEAHGYKLHGVLQPHDVRRKQDIPLSLSVITSGVVHDKTKWEYCFKQCHPKEKEYCAKPDWWRKDVKMFLNAANMCIYMQMPLSEIVVECLEYVALVVEETNKLYRAEMERKAEYQRREDEAIESYTADVLRLNTLIRGGCIR